MIVSELASFKNIEFKKGKIASIAMNSPKDLNCLNS